MTMGYHVLGNYILDSWENLGVKEAQDVEEVIARATRDIRLLVGFLDADVGMLASLTEGYITGSFSNLPPEASAPDAEERGEEVPTGPAGVPHDALQNMEPAPPRAPQGQLAEPIAPPTRGAAQNVPWPAEEFATLGDLGKWVYAHHQLGMSAILRMAKKRSVSELRIAEAKTAVERILRTAGVKGPGQPDKEKARPGA